MNVRASLIATIVAGAILAIAPASAVRQSPTRHEASRMSMGSAYSLVLYGPDAASLARIADEAFDEVDRLDRLMSHYKPESPLSRLNRDAARGPVVVDPELFDLIAESVRYSREWDGAFDITVGPLMKAWGFFLGDGRLPPDDEIAALRGRVGYRHVLLDPRARTIRFDRSGIELDLGGIGKGYAVDAVVRVLTRRGVTAALVSAGGSTLYGLGAPPDREAWDVELQDPLDSSRVAMTIPLRDRALSVSGSAEKFFEVKGVRYSHIMDPRTARPVQDVLGVAVLAATGTAGDALDNAFFVAGLDRTRARIAGLAGTEAYFFIPDTARAPQGWRSVHLP